MEFGMQGPDCIEVNTIKPATKIQQDLLFQKMKEAGYEWDSEKKRLKKIDNEEINGEDYGIDGLRHAQRILEKTLGSVEGYQSDDGILEHKCAISAVKKLYDQKPTWTEEDENILDAITYTVKNSGYKHCIGVSNEMMITFIESLKQRYTWKPSDEYINALEYFIRSLGESDYSSSYSYDSKMELLRLLLFDLKKLKE
jgi:hypothetical protein